MSSLLKKKKKIQVEEEGMIPEGGEMELTKPKKQ